MNEQEKALQGVLEFCQWLIPNAKQLGLEKSKSIVAISQAKTQEDIINGVNSLYQELGEEQFTALTQAFQKSKVKKHQLGGKMDYLITQLRRPAKHESFDSLNIDGRTLKTRTSSDNTYSLNTDGKDSVIMWLAPHDDIFLRNDGPDNTGQGNYGTFENGNRVYRKINGEDSKQLVTELRRKFNFRH